MSNTEKKHHSDHVHVLLGLARVSHGEKSQCIRVVDKGFGYELDVFEAQLKVIGGYWRIHRSVNARDCEKARKHLLCTLINHPEKASHIDSAWRTALLQHNCVYGKKKFMLDIDTEDENIIGTILYAITMAKGEVLERIKSPKGWHYITTPFDTRNVCELADVTLLRDGYYFVKEVGSLKQELINEEELIHGH